MSFNNMSQTKPSTDAKVPATDAAEANKAPEAKTEPTSDKK